MDFLSLLSGSGLASTDGPNGLVGDNNLAEILLSEVEDAAFQLSLHHLVLLVGLALSERLTDAEDYLQTVLQGQQHLLLQNLWSLLVVFAAL